MSTGPLTGYALITGATAGLGASFSRRLAAEGRDLILVARDVDRLEATAAELRERYPITVEVLPADLSTVQGSAAVASRIAQDAQPVDTLINNAGFGLYRAFGKAPLADEQRMLDLNVRAVLTLTHAAVGAMTARGRGEIINISSVAGFLPRGAAATYAAGKAWVTSFTEGVALLLIGTGVRITVICPGFVRTEFHQRASADMSGTPSLLWLDADRVVADGLADARAGKVISVPSKRYRTIVTLVKLLPRPLVARVMVNR
ncbi:MAG: SDR family NAD(P)-dependent oxidoreductase [Actinomycetota bacterium]|nr:SDR family NAD(P)-dependent oxidoreductase [Actinomycetota bacterium]MDQ2958139.1 SDR family NAD(P)-dependent oxidoreductase [Actinomycetota bacterium]